MKKKILTILAVLVLLVAAFFLYRHFHKENLGVSPPNPYADSEITAEVFPEGNGFGYDILIDGQIYVHQANIPAVGGNQTFKSESDANLAADLVISKIRQNILPPTVTVEELQTLGVI